METCAVILIAAIHALLVAFCIGMATDGKRLWLWTLALWLICSCLYLFEGFLPEEWLFVDQFVVLTIALNSSVHLLLKFQHITKHRFAPAKKFNFWFGLGIMLFLAFKFSKLGILAFNVLPSVSTLPWLGATCFFNLALTLILDAFGIETQNQKTPAPVQAEISNL